MCFSPVAGGSTATLYSITKTLRSRVQCLIRGSELRLSSFCVMVSCAGSFLTTDPRSSKESYLMPTKTQHFTFFKQCCGRFTSSGTLDPPFPEGIFILTQQWGLCGHMILRAMLAVTYATGKASHSRQVKGDDPDKKGYPDPPGWGLGVGLTTPPSKKTYCYESRAKEKAGQIK